MGKEVFFAKVPLMKWLNSLLGDETGQKPGFSAPPADQTADAEPAAALAPPMTAASAGPVVVSVSVSESADARWANEGGATAERPPVVEAEPTAPPLFAELAAAQRSLAEQQRELNELFSTRLRSDEAQARAVEKLHDELRQYKSNFVRQQILPVLKEVIFCHDFVTNELARVKSALAPVESQGGREEANSEAAGSLAISRADAAPGVKSLEIARQMLQDLLFKYDVEPFRSDEEAFDPKSQQCTQTMPTERSELDKMIAARGLEGFRGPDGIVRREQVTVYKFQPGVS